MLRSQWSESKLRLRRSGRIAVLCLLAAIAGLPAASAQTDFTMTLNPPSLSPTAVPPGGTSSLSIQVATATGFSGTITLGCTVTPSVAGTVSNPVCQVSPGTLSGSGAATATITTTATTTTVSYGITITGTDASGTASSQTLSLTVLSVTPQFTITVQTAVAPTSVIAGSGAEGVISINPINGYSSPTDSSDPSKYGVYLSCATVSPLVTIPPVCSFSPPHPQVTVGSATSTLTITTFGPVLQSGSIRRWPFYALWLPLPLLALAGFGAAAGKGKRSRKAWGLLALFVLAGGVLLVPACSNVTPVSTVTANGVTPANTYTFTIVGVDINGVASSNTGADNSTGPTVTLTVTAPK